MSELSDFTKLVLDRMESNPEEFFTVNQGYTRWQGLVRGLEALARGDTESREYNVLWPLSEGERQTLLDGYRKLYLKELHRDMLKNIVSGDDKDKYNISIDRGYQAGVGKSSKVLTTSAMQQQTLATLNSAFDTVYAKAEGQPVQMSNTNTAYKFVAEQQREKVTKTLVTPTDHKMAARMGMDVLEYVKRRDAV